MASILNNLSRMRDRSHIQLSAKTVVKRGSAKAIAVEAAKTRKAAEIGRRSRLFRVPEVREHDAVNGILILERIRDFVPIVHPIAYRRNGIDLINRCASALTVIHQQLTLPEEYAHKLPPPMNGDGDDQVVLHGDFNTANVVYLPRSDELVVLDWSLSPLLGGLGTVGSPCVDVAWFVQGLFIRPMTYILSRRPAPCADLFLQAYEEKIGRRLNRGRLREVGMHVHEVVTGMFGRSPTRYRLHSRQLARLKRYFDRVN